MSSGNAHEGLAFVRSALEVPETDEPVLERRSSSHNRPLSDSSSSHQQGAAAAEGAARAMGDYGHRRIGGIDLDSVVGAPERWHAPEDIDLGMWKLGLHVDSELDVKDTVDKWCEATVTAIDREAQRVRITYTYWVAKWDEWLSLDSPRVAPSGTRVYREGGPLRVGHRLEVLDETNHWLQADVVEESPNGSAMVRFKGFHNKFNMWVSPHGNNVRQFGPYRVVPKGNRSARQASLAPGQQHVRQIAQLSNRYEHYSGALRSKGLRVVPVEGDGNCLFRSVSHQVYGDDRHHRLVRACCMDYMESEAHFFEPYVEGDMAAFLRYLDVKRHNAVWGDDPEVQALCEIYDRSAEIWAYDPQLGAKTLRTFHESGGSGTGHAESSRSPMRLSYYGGGHYDSVSVIIPAAAAGYAEPSLIREEGGGPSHRRAPLGPGVVREPPPDPGLLEEEALARSRRRAEANGSGRWDLEERKVVRDEEGPSEQAVMDHALACSRNVFEAQFGDIDSALVASVDHMERSNMSSLEAAARDSELVVLQEEMLRTAQAQSEEEQLRNALQASCNIAATAEAEADMVRHAIAESVAAASSAGAAEGKVELRQGKAGGTEGAMPGTKHEEESFVVGATEDSEEKELMRALMLSRSGEEWGPPSDGAGARATQEFGLDGLQEDAELTLAIEASLASE